MTDLILELWVAGLIERTKLSWMLGMGESWKAGQPLKLLCAGYNGTRNTGSDVRVEEMLRQVRRVLGAQNIALTVMTQDFNRTRGYFGDAQQVHLPDIFPPFLYRETRRHHGVIACEGSMFKSKFADALTTMMIGALGIASAENKISLGYGAEAGHMNPFLARLCRQYCGQSLILTRNEASQAVLSELGIPSELGADSAWTFEPHGPEVGRRTLEKAGWDGRAPVMVVCPIHPFWWPVKPSLWKYAGHEAWGAYKDSHYRTLYFHKSGPRVDAAFARYIADMARAVAAFRERHGAFVILCAMEELDERACTAMARRMDGGSKGRTPIFSSNEYDMYEMVSILRTGDLMVSSRYHGMVTSMPALVPAAGVTMDERIRNLLQEEGREDLLMTVDDPDLEDKLLMAMEILRKDTEAIRYAMGSTVVANLKRMSRMGVFVEQNVHERYPDFPVRDGVRSWEEYLPPLSPPLERLVEKYESRAHARAAG